jgi:hypothetical protein
MYKYITVDGYRAIVFYDVCYWVAVCLEHDIGTQSSTPEIVIERLEESIRVERNMTNNKHINISPSPREFHDMWDSTTEFYNRKIRL